MHSTHGIGIQKIRERDKNKHWVVGNLSSICAYMSYNLYKNNFRLFIT